MNFLLILLIIVFIFIFFNKTKEPFDGTCINLYLPKLAFGDTSFNSFSNKKYIDDFKVIMENNNDNLDKLNTYAIQDLRTNSDIEPLMINAFDSSFTLLNTNKCKLDYFIDSY